MRKAVFLDKDGTLIENIPYNTDSNKINILPGVTRGLKKLSDFGFLLIIITNQSGIARGYFSEDTFGKMRKAFLLKFSGLGIKISGFYYCPHHPDGSVFPYNSMCYCRKPMAGLIHEAAINHEVDINGSWMVGDILDDIEAGNRAGCRTILINNGNETEWKTSALRSPDFSAFSVDESAEVISRFDYIGQR